MARHRLAAKAKAELDEIWLYVARNSGSIEVADRLLESISERFLLLARNPRIGRPRDDLRPGLRSFPAGEYVIMYRVENDAVRVLHVARGSRNLEALLGD